jgi:hypothetical protein
MEGVKHPDLIACLPFYTKDYFKTLDLWKGYRLVKFLAAKLKCEDGVSHRFGSR